MPPLLIALPVLKPVLVPNATSDFRGRRLDDSHGIPGYPKERDGPSCLMLHVSPRPEASVMGLWGLSEGTGKAYPGGS